MHRSRVSLSSQNAIY